MTKFFLWYVTDLGGQPFVLLCAAILLVLLTPVGRCRELLQMGATLPGIFKSPGYQQTGWLNYHGWKEVLRLSDYLPLHPAMPSRRRHWVIAEDIDRWGDIQPLWLFKYPCILFKHTACNEKMRHDALRTLLLMLLSLRLTKQIRPDIK